jgi:hypothetical protein
MTSSKPAKALQDANQNMSNQPVGSTASPCADLCPKCHRQRHDTGRYPRSSSERRTALLRDADDPESELSENARKFINKTNGENVPPGYQVSHEVPLYTVPKSDRCELDVADNLKTQPKKKHRARHRRCGQQYHDYPA